MASAVERHTFRYKLKTMKNTLTLVDDNGVELLVSYSAKMVRDDDNIFCGYDVELDCVELVVAGKGINILPVLDTRQRHWIEAKVEDCVCHTE